MSQAKVLTEKEIKKVVKVIDSKRHATRNRCMFLCIDPAVSAQVKLLKHMPRQGSSFSAPDEGAGGYRSRSNPQ